MMIATASPATESHQRNPAVSGSMVCPKCHGLLKTLAKNRGWHCSGCRHDYLNSAGLIDLRLFSDRYLSLNQERQKALRLSQYEDHCSLEELARSYYRMTADVSPLRRERFVRHILDAHCRGQALLARIPASGRILEIGCGTGGFLQAALAAGRDITGVDIASRWLVIARKRLVSLNLSSSVNIIAACAEALPFPSESFDHIVADSLLEHIGDLPKVIQEIQRVLRPGGTATFWSPNRYWPGPDPHVGLCGIGFMPRQFAESYKNLRRGDIYLPHLNSPRAWAHEISVVTQLSRKSSSAGDFRAWPLTDKSVRGRVARVLGWLSIVPVARSVMTSFGPVGEIVFEKSGQSCP